MNPNFFILPYLYINFNLKQRTVSLFDDFLFWKTKIVYLEKGYLNFFMLIEVLCLNNRWKDDRELTFFFSKLFILERKLKATHKSILWFVYLK